MLKNLSYPLTTIWCFFLLGPSPFPPSFPGPLADARSSSWARQRAGTVLLDFGVLAQFFLYRGAREADRLAAAEARANGGVAPPSAAQTAVPTSGATATATAGAVNSCWW